MSDLVNSCEYLNINKLCTAFEDNFNVDNSSRQLKCKNNQKTTCCYLCVFRVQCIISCKYLERSENYTETKSITKDSYIVDKDLHVETLPLEKVLAACCSSCNTEMAWTKTHLTVDDWRGNKSLLLNVKMLPVTVLLCPKCGEIKFKTDLI